MKFFNYAAEPEHFVDFGVINFGSTSKFCDYNHKSDKSEILAGPEHLVG
jgi:hypothetical protein